MAIINYGAGFDGSPSILTTNTANQEIVLNDVVYYKFSFANYSDCTIRINGSDPIFLPEGQGFVSDANDAPISSFIVLESGIMYNWIGAYKFKRIEI